MTSSPLFQLPNTYRAFYGAFSTLQPFQIEVINPILHGCDVILQAATGSGKTEAILAPCLERVIRASEPETILYVVPTRALVHDLRRRLEPVLHDRLGLQLGIRTGDVKRLPSGRADLLLTTPESLDVMLGSSNREVRAFLRAVTTIVVDEVHQLVDGYRGRHLAYLMQHLERLNHRRLQKITLSATLSGPDAIRESLGLQPDAIWLSNPVQRRIRPHLIHLKREPGELVAFLDDLAMRFNARKILLFANSRSRCDQLFSWLSQQGYFRQSVFLHYSNLKLQQRQEVERQFQRRREALCIATSTLELGIDVGDVDSVILYEPPESVTTFLQRLGRAGRQSQTTTFWGICRSERAGLQLLQFLALYNLAQHGEVEAVHPAELPSVLVQQMLSTLYAHREVSLGMLQKQFPAEAKTVAKLAPALEGNHWLRRQKTHGRQPRWRGGWRYVEALKANRIWSNFPETETPYVLQIEDQAVADLPPVIVRQLDPGDHVDLAGRCIRILDISDGERKVVRAELAETSDTKPLYWVGTGPPVSWEVAQAMRPLLQPGYEPVAALAQGLFTRTRTLLQEQQLAAGRRVILHNGIELSRTPLGFYRYTTYLGTVGNVILQRTIASYYGERIDDFVCTSDAIAVACSDLIDWQPLPLPLHREALRHWIANHLKAIQALFAFNAFARALPRDLLIEEAADWLWDERLAEVFSIYRQQSSEIAEGDPRHLEWDGPQETIDVEPLAEFNQPDPLEPSILAQEKARLGISANAQPMLPAVPVIHQQPRALTGTMVGSYIQHQQCDRLLSFDLLPYAEQPPKRALVDSALGAARAGEGQAFEAWVLAWLEQRGERLYNIGEQDEAGRRLTLKARQAQGLTYLTEAIQTADHRTPGGSQTLCMLAQAVFMVPASDGEAMPVDGVGIPDLIEVALEDEAVVLTIADIKDSATPRYSQKWQVAFYAALIQAWLPHHTFALPVRVAAYGVLWTRPEAGDTAPSRHEFDLAPYLDVFPLFARHVTKVLNTPVAEATWQLQSHCATCDYVDTCYRQALSVDDVMLTPHLTAGALLKLQDRDLGSLDVAAEWAHGDAQHDEAPLTGEQAAQLRTKIRALIENRAGLLTSATSLYPARIDTVIYLHILRNPHSGRPRAWALYPWPEAGEPDAITCRIAATEADITACHEAFCQQLLQWRHAHIVTFGPGSLSLLSEETATACELVTWLDDIRQAEPPRHTDLRQLLRQHVALPIPLQYTLSAVARVWQLTPEPTSSGDLLSDDGRELEVVFMDDPLREDQVDALRAYLETHIKWQQQVWQICTRHLRSDWTPGVQVSDANAVPGWQADCVNFLQLQQHRRERDIFAVQQLPLPERVARYRALGPLEFQEITLDAEGRFLAHFLLPPDDTPSRFRPGDFLRLNPVGSPDLQGGSGAILTQFDPHARRLAVTSRQGRLALSQRMRYVLDEDLEDWTTPRVLHAVREGTTPGKHPHLMALLEGRLPLPQPHRAAWRWVQQWLPHAGLNARQSEALCLPFHSRLALIEGPPGTGKTHLLAWMLIALILEAAQAGRPMRLAVSALTHQAIDNVLRKVNQLLHSRPDLNFPARCLKWGQPPAGEGREAETLTYVDQAEEVLPAPYLILGATGFGLYQLFESRTGAFPAFFDWVIFDEASQVVLPQALLSLIYGKGQYIFCGDVNQLPPVIRGRQTAEGEASPERSILAHLLDTYPADAHVRLNETFRLNRELCALPSRLWYDGDLQPATGNADTRLVRPVPPNPDRIDAILAPEHPVTLVLADHTTDEQLSAVEVEIIAALAERLLLDDGFEAEHLAILAPHRAQNNAIARRLRQRLAPGAELPIIDTVERLQGAERDVILFSLTTSAPDHLESPFLNNPNRFNVAITRARHKLVVVGSRAFFTRVPRTEAGLLAHRCFTAYYHLCREGQALFEFDVLGS
ncbi:DEAD/DEAH box helicase [Candidatus Entotheonella palauensis]|uniref:DEAD/DEAH box helicase n=1 Tax=Candidatus Entotheonella palauensis TaxID=93172 RepID=UPI000B7E8521|nr:DEAD/DEAH box helicase [Candidatus Entotheonella palauensis]